MDPGNANEIGCASMLLISILGITSLITFFRTIYLFIQSLKRKTFDISLASFHIRIVFWLVLIISVTNYTPRYLDHIHAFQGYPFVAPLLCSLLMGLAAWVYYLFRPFPSKEWLLVLFPFCPPVVFVVVRNKLTRPETPNPPLNSDPTCTA